MVPEYLQKEAEEGKTVDLTMSEFADPWMRFCLDMNRGGAMIDLRPYAAKLIRPRAASARRTSRMPQVPPRRRRSGLVRLPNSGHVL
jgi:hypothetical protein